jgi:hypothetical protein
MTMLTRAARRLLSGGGGAWAGVRGGSEATATATAAASSIHHAATGHSSRRVVGGGRGLGGLITAAPRASQPRLMRGMAKRSRESKPDRAALPKPGGAAGAKAVTGGKAVAGATEGKSGGMRSSDKRLAYQLGLESIPLDPKYCESWFWAQCAWKVHRVATSIPPKLETGFASGSECTLIMQDSMRPERSNENSYFGVGERRSGDKGEAGAGEAAAAESTGAAAEDGGWGGVASDVAVGLCTLNQVDP